jgi:DNA polymerase I-like protein with 3'-5' exonuclease and polymerase domains
MPRARKTTSAATTHRPLARPRTDRPPLSTGLFGDELAPRVQVLGPQAVTIAPRPDGWTPTPLPVLNGETHICGDFETGCEPGKDARCWWDGAFPVGLAWYLPQSGRRGYTGVRHTEGNATDPATLVRWLNDLRGMHWDNAQTKFDMHISRANGADLVKHGNTFGDVQHRAALLDDNRFTFNLDQLAKDFLPGERAKVVLPFDKGRMAEVPAWMVDPYAVEDVVLVGDLVQATDPLIDAEDLRRVLTLEQDVLPVVVEMEKNGAFLDLERLFAWQQQARHAYEEKLRFIQRETGIALQSPDERKNVAAIFHKLGIPHEMWHKPNQASELDEKPSARKSKQPSFERGATFTEDVLKRSSGHPVIKALYDAGQLGDLLSKYLDKYAKTVRQSDGWIRFNLHQLRNSKDDGNGFGAVSGRFSSAGDEHGGFNVQQVVSADKQTSRGWCTDYVIRNLFLPGSPEERASAKPPKWLAADAKQIEYRIFGAISRAEAILEAYRNDPETDYHDIVQVMLKRAMPEILRKQTKITNFCKLFGAAELKFAWTLGTINDQEFAELDARYKGVRGKGRKLREIEAPRYPGLALAIEVYDAYDREFPDAKRMCDLCKKVASERGYVKTLYGRRARFGRRNGRVHSGMNRVVQGTAADINKLMLVDVYNHRDELGLKLRFTVHDELDADVHPDADVPAIEKFFNIQRLELAVPILWDVGIGESWGTAKGKA